MPIIKAPTAFVPGSDCTVGVVLRSLRAFGSWCPETSPFLPAATLAQHGLSLTGVAVTSAEPAPPSSLTPHCLDCEPAQGGLRAPQALIRSQGTRLQRELFPLCMNLALFWAQPGGRDHGRMQDPRPRVTVGFLCPVGDLCSWEWVERQKVTGIRHPSALTSSPIAPTPGPALHKSCLLPGAHTCACSPASVQSWAERQQGRRTELQGGSLSPLEKLRGQESLCDE